MVSQGNPAGSPPVTLALTSDIVPPGELYDYADSVVKQKISELPGVADVVVSGGERSAVVCRSCRASLPIWVYRRSSCAFALRAATVNLPTGSFTIGDQSFTVRPNDQLKAAAADYRESS